MNQDTYPNTPLSTMPSTVSNPAPNVHPPIQQAMILAAGKGTRMRPLTLTTPKPLVMVAGKPLIVWHIERLRQAGIYEITVNLGHLGQVLRDALGAMSLGVNLHFSDETVFDEPLETAGGIKYALDQGHLDDRPFVLVNGDVWSEFDYRLLVERMLVDQLGHLILTPNPSHNLDGDFSLVGAQVMPKSSHLKAKDHGGQDSALHTFAGLSVLSPRLFDVVPYQAYYRLAPILTKAMEAGKITGQLCTATWVDVGTPERLAWVNDYVYAQSVDT